MRSPAVASILVGVLAAIVLIHPISSADDKTKTVFAASMLAEHNEWRAKYNVPPLTWDDDLAADAQQFANQVVLKNKFPPTHRSGSSNGENFFWGTASAFEPKDAVARWESESKNYDRTANTCTAGKTCVHFTQLVWSTTKKVGCAKATTADGETDFFVCVYNPAGNMDGLGPFSALPATSDTPDNTSQPRPNASPSPSSRPAARRVG
jgi:pathogenesis-related protein 1